MEDDATSLGFFALRQGSSGPVLTFGGLRVANTWVPESGATTFAFIEYQSMLVGIWYQHQEQIQAGMLVGDWWPNQDPAFSVFLYNGIQYLPATTAVPGEGYWMNNSLTETYSYPAIGIVAHDPIPVTIGWNMIGGYETSPTITALKAANPQITGSVFEYNGIQYFPATNLVPGYGYWVEVTTTDPITIPSALSKGSGEVVELFKEDWGRITLTDAEGKSYTLYAVKGEVDLRPV